MTQRLILFLAVLLLLPGLAQAKIFLEDTNDTLRVTTASSVTTIHMYGSWADITTTAITPGSSTARVTTATTTALVGSPGASTQRQIKGLTIRNNHASSSNAITVDFFDGTNATELVKYTLLAGETLQWAEDEGFNVIDASGQIKGLVAATQSGTWNITNVSGTVSLPTGAATAANQDGIIKDGTGDTTQANVSSGRLHVDGSGVTQPVSGTVTANAGTGTFFDGILKDGTGDTTQANVISGSLSVNCTNCSGSGASHIDNAAFTGGSDDVAPMGALYDTTPPTITDGNMGAPRMDSNRYLYVDCVVGCSGGASTPADNFANPTTAGLTMGFNMGWDGANWDRLPGTSTDGLLVNLGANNDVTVTGTVTANAGTGTFNIQSNASVNLAQIGGSSIQAASNGLNTAGTGLGTQALTGQCDDTTPTTLTENQFGHVRVDCANHALKVDNLSIAGTTISTGNGTSGAGVQRVTIASDSTGTVAVTQATASNLNVRSDTSGATGAAPPARANFTGGLGSGATGGFVTGIPVCDTFANVNVTTATTTLLITGVSGRHVRICGMSLVTAAANNVALISGTGATCGTGTTGMNGGTSAASGWNFAANSGLTQGNGLGTINSTNATGDSVCIVTSAATQLSGRIAYTIY